MGDPIVAQELRQCPAATEDPSEIQRLTQRLEEQAALLERVTFALGKAGIRLPRARAVHPQVYEPHRTFATFMAWCRGAGVERLHVAGAKHAPKNCLGVIDDEHVYVVGAAVAVALDMDPSADTSEITHRWLMLGLLDANPNWDGFSMNSAKWSKSAPWVGTRKMFRARLDAPSCAG